MAYSAWCVGAGWGWRGVQEDRREKKGGGGYNGGATCVYLARCAGAAETVTSRNVPRNWAVGRNALRVPLFSLAYRFLSSPFLSFFRFCFLSHALRSLSLFSRNSLRYPVWRECSLSIQRGRPPHPDIRTTTAKGRLNWRTRPRYSFQGGASGTRLSEHSQASNRQDDDTRRRGAASSSLLAQQAGSGAAQCTMMPTAGA
ncbi:hypothetical protein EJ06DRAFT_530505 [Trichodelitschia bisporula]|uniref:Uncharacterized protein n=1 Tax=Trichodelitschia bisporula TaxID=703511 RepID=A0A6G1HWV7_9PEZI|nr:hypothetical protein EJ06DRAFT_530505 [Trichodelitschia bisporula]